MRHNFFSNFIFKILCCFSIVTGYSQNYWQQRVEYRMDIDFDVTSNMFSGTQTLKYYNNSPDTLKKVFYHLYFNAFQPKSMMDTRSRTISDPDRRVMDRIFQLDSSEIGFHKILSLKQDSEVLNYKIEGTVLEVALTRPILPQGTSTFTMEFESQVPVQIRRSGRDNTERIKYSMSQWYPKMAEYDKRGWHAHPYVGREFHAPWGDFTVNISIDKDYILAGTGTLQNPNKIGYGYEEDGVEVKRKGKKLTWKFLAKDVHDFVWAADPGYKHVKTRVKDGPELHFFYKENEKTEAWNELPGLAVKAFEFIEKNYGEYPYSHYSVIQGGDGGMEYPMATLITGERNLRSLVEVTVHEALHSWYQGLLATNESYYAWMDEGFTTYATAETTSAIFKDTDRAQERNYQRYKYLVSSGKEEPLSTHADHFMTNAAYGMGSYTKGAIALAQMNYLIGKQKTASALKSYYYQWRFKHPDANDWISVFEKKSGLELDWYLDHWINTTHFIDYAIKKAEAENGQTKVTMERLGKMPMPMDIYVTFTDESKMLYYAPLVIMRGEKENEGDLERIILPDWPWTHPEYEFTIDRPIDQVKSIQIDESGYLADINPKNNKWEKE
ncbi:MAG: M1 family metallopeptidase [Ekhidna sp.]|nr:M1 family metallopeptidase [Ekhidna sp.]